MGTEETMVDVGDADEKAVNVVIEEEGGKPSAARVEEADPPAKGKPEAQAADSDDDDEELKSYSDKVRRRIGRMTFQAREAERQRDEAINAAKVYQQQAADLQKRVGLTDRNLIKEYGNRLTVQEELLNKALSEAIERGDATKQIELTKSLSTLAIEQERVKAAKLHYEREDAAAKEQPVPQPPKAETQQAQPKPDPKAQRWAENNEWFGKDDAMTFTAFAHHKRLVNDGWDPTSDDYYKELDRNMRKDFPHKFKDKEVEEENPNPRPNPPRVVAGARPNVNPVTSSANGKTQVRLTPSQVAIARRLGVPLDQYAKEVVKLNG